jgi:putative transposase
MDNLSSHKDPAIRGVIRSVGAKLFYLPPYNPDLNPIEQAFSKLKTLLRKENARSREAVEHAIGRLLNKLTATECRNFSTDAGYASTGSDRPPIRTLPDFECKSLILFAFLEWRPAML